MMATALANDLRVRVMADIDAGLSAEKAAVKYSVSARTIYHWKSLRSETGTLDPRQGKTGPKPKLANERERIEAALKADPSLTLADLLRNMNLSVGMTTLWNALRAWGLSHKKSR